MKIHTLSPLPPPKYLRKNKKAIAHAAILDSGTYERISALEAICRRKTSHNRMRGKMISAGGDDYR